LAAGFLYTFVGIILLQIDPLAQERMLHRIVITAAFFLLIVGSFYSDKIKSRINILTTITLVLGSVWAIYICNLNEFRANYIIVLFTAIAATASVLLSKTLIFGFLFSVTAALMYLLDFSTGQYSFNPEIFPLATTILLCIFLITENYKSQIASKNRALQSQLKNSNSGLEEMVTERTKLLHEKNKELQHLNYAVSHDLKSPLRNIHSFASLIKMKLNSDDVESVIKYTQIINDSAEKMTTIIEDILDYGRINQQTIEFSEINLKELIYQNKDLVINKILEPEHKFSIGSKFPKTIICCKNQISALLQNLISNAIKYNESNKKSISFSYSASPTHHIISIKDNGIGISEEYQEKIFEMFTRLHTSAAYEGTGVGLSLCKKVAQNHKGELWLESNNNKGSTFSFSISKDLEVSLSNIEENELVELLG